MRWMIAIVVLLGLILAALAGAGPGAEDAVPPDRAELDERLNQLERRVEALEQQGRRLLLPAPRELPDAAPEGWIPREHNGIRYYIVPLEPEKQQR